MDGEPRVPREELVVVIPGRDATPRGEPEKWLDVNTLSGGAVFEFENKVGFMKLNVFNAAVGGIAAQQGIVSSAEQKFRRLPL